MTKFLRLQLNEHKNADFELTISLLRIINYALERYEREVSKQLPVESIQDSSLVEELEKVFKVHLRTVMNGELLKATMALLIQISYF